MFKALILAALSSFVLIHATASMPFDEDGGVGAPKVRYLSWCNQGKVIRADENGKETVEANCTENGTRCMQEERVLGTIYHITAACRHN